MTNILKLLFSKNKPVSIHGSLRVEPERKKLNKELRRIDESFKRIDRENRKMKKSIDTALAIAMTTGGLS